MVTIFSNQKRRFHRALLAAYCCSLFIGTTPASADEFSWNAGSGSWFDAANWTPNGNPGGGDAVYVGDLPGIQNSLVLLGEGIAAAAADHLEISSGMIVDLNGTEWVATGGDGDVVISGTNSRMIVRPREGLNFHDFNGRLFLGEQSYFELTDGVDVRIHPNSVSNGTIVGRGNIEAYGGAGFTNNGVIRPDANGGIVINVFGTNPNFNLDGTTGNGHLQLNQLFSVLEVNAAGLTDSFSGTVSMAPGALLAMNIDEGWAADSNSTINVGGFNNPAAASQISGTALAFGGQMNIGGAQGHLRVLAPMTIQNSALVSIGATDWLELDGTSIVQGGQFALGQGGKLDFDGPTTMQGGVFDTHSNSIVDGFVAFNGPTTWNGNVTLNGASRQNGNATVGGAGTVINAGIFDMDGGLGNTNWNINGNLVVNADHVGAVETNRFNGTFNVAGGFFPRLTMNLTHPASSWVMGGTMNLTGLTNLFESRVAGSHMIVEGDLNVTGGRVRIDADTTFSSSGGGGGADVQIGPPDSVLRMHGNTIVESNVSFTGMGTLQNAASGQMNLMDGVSLGSVGLFNQGVLDLDENAGAVSVYRFGNTGTWQVDIGGLLAGDEHDLLVVGGEALLGGLLDVSLIDAGSGLFTPDVGDSFTILTSLDGVNGTFLNDPVSLLGGHQYHWSVLYNSNDVQLQLTSVSVPEPGSLFVLAAFSSLLLLRRRGTARS